MAERRWAVHFHEAFEAESEQAAIEELANWNAVENEPQAVLAYNDGDGWFSLEGERLEPMDLEKAKDKVLVWHDKMPNESGEAALRLLDVVVKAQRRLDGLRNRQVRLEASIMQMSDAGMTGNVAHATTRLNQVRDEILTLEWLLSGRG